MTTVLKALGSLATAAALLSAAPAFAESSFCATIPSIYIFNCSTAPIPSNQSGRFAYFEVGPFSTYNFRDSQNQIILRHGTTGAGIHSEVVTGLFAFYHVEIAGPYFLNSYGYVNNT